jgi:hypothetical protein
MSLLWAKIVIVGIPFTLSMAWFLFWVVRIRKEQKKLKERKAREQRDPRRE